MTTANTPPPMSALAFNVRKQLMINFGRLLSHSDSPSDLSAWLDGSAIVHFLGNRADYVAAIGVALDDLLAALTLVSRAKVAPRAPGLTRNPRELLQAFCLALELSRDCNGLAVWVGATTDFYYSGNRDDHFTALRTALVILLVDAQEATI